MEGIVHEAQLWNELRPDAPIWAMVTTGGASPLLREHGVRNVREPDREIIEELGLDPTAPPYDLIMNCLIRGLFRSP